MILWKSGSPEKMGSTKKAMLLTMKLSTIVLLAISLQASAYGFSQKVTLAVKNAPLQKVFKEINKQTGYQFFFKDNLLNQAGKVDLNVRNMPLEEVLHICFQHLPITYTIIDQTIVLKERESAPVFQKVAPPAIIKGRVTDTTGRPLSGASVSIKGTKTGVSTDQDGYFSIEADMNQTLVISYIGFNESLYTIGSTSAFIEINLIQQQAELTRVAVVLTGYQQLPKERSAGSYASVTNEAIKNKSVSMNVIDRLEGLVPGLSVNYGQGNEKFLIRGLTSINSNRSPLIVVDGVPMYDGNTLTTLVNPEDVESVNVLRDATAASIWGAAAANGVVVITTKKGPQGSTPRKMQVGYSGFVSLRGQPDMDYYNLMNSAQLVQAGREVFDIAAYPWAVVTTSSSANSRPVVAPHEQAMYDQARGIISAAAAQNRFDSLGRLTNSAQVQNLLFQSSMLTNHNINFKGGSNVYGYYGSVGYTRDESYNKNNTDRYQLNFRQDFSVSKAVHLDLTTNIAFENSERQLLTDFPGTANTLLPYAMLSDNAGNPLSMAYLQRHDPFRATSEAQSGINLDYIPLREPGFTRNATNRFNARINAGLSVKLFKGLTYEGRAQYQRQASEGYDYYDQNSYRVRNERVFFTQAPITPTANPTYYLPVSGGHYLTNNTTQYAWTVRNQFVYDNTFREKHQLTALAGTELRNDFTKGLGTFKEAMIFRL
jgi:TonB-dependent SusC/RagA subfamily outer membrane receptor